MSNEHENGDLLSDEWLSVEVWMAQDFLDPPYPYILLLVEKQGGMFCVIEPYMKNQISFKSKSYQEAKDWMNEDEFSRYPGSKRLLNARYSANSEEDID
jgi:hypothetical protein